MARYEEEVLNAVALRGTISVRELATLLNVSEQTVRRVVQPLVERGVVDKVHGAVVGRSRPGEAPFLARMTVHQREKVAIAGAVATDVPMSTWFLLCTSFGSLFIVTGKRYAELREYGDHAGAARASLDDYTLGFLRIVLSVSVGATLVTYCIWAFDTKEISGSTWPFYELSIVPMVTALLRYTLILEQGHGAAPEEIFAADRTLQVLGLLWAVVFGLGVYVA